jgi:hypothetical protein
MFSSAEKCHRMAGSCLGVGPHCVLGELMSNNNSPSGSSLLKPGTFSWFLGGENSDLPRLVLEGLGADMLCRKISQRVAPG